MESILKRRFWLLLAVLLTCLVTVQVTSMRGETETWDEGMEIASGYSFLRTGSYRIVPEHPPMARVIAAVPLLWLNPSVPTDDPSWTNGDVTEFGRAFLYRNRVPADAIIFAARVPMVMITALLAAVVALWTRRTFGATAGLLSAALVVFDPNIVANGRYIKNDILVTLFCFLSVVAWGEYLTTARRRWLLAAGTGFGLAVVTKFSALFLLPVFALLWLAARWHRREPLAPWRALISLLILCAMTVPVIAIAYAPEWRKLRPATRTYRAAHPEVRRLTDAIQPATPMATRFADVCQRLGCQDHPFFVGFLVFLGHTTRGHESYFLGSISETGRWSYFPIAFLVKTPVATLCLIVLALMLATWEWIKAPLRFLRIEWWLCIVPFAIYGAAAIVNNVNIGLRHLLPLYPFLFAAMAAVATNHARRLRKRVVTAMVALLIIESAAVYPHYLAYFNFAVGGPGAGPRYLLDSNLDWGQDLHHLRDYWIARGRPKLCLEYFGNARPEYYGFKNDRVPRTWEREERESMNCLAAVSATPLYGLYVRSKGGLDWLREREPVAKIGYSIYVYDLRKPGAPPPANGR